MELVSGAPPPLCSARSLTFAVNFENRETSNTTESNTCSALFSSPAIKVIVASLNSVAFGNVEDFAKYI